MKKSKLVYSSCNSTPRASPRISPRQKNIKTIPLLDKIKPPQNPKHCKSLLKDISNRSKIASEASISTETAVSVVKSYILPMFEQDLKQKSDNKRSSAYSRKFSADSSGVYGEFKLSERLSNEKEKLSSSLKLNETQLKENFQTLEILKKENFELKKINEELKTNLEFLMFDNQKLRIEVDRMTFSLIFEARQFGKYKSLFDRVNKELQDCSRDLHRLNILNDIRLNL